MRYAFRNTTDTPIRLLVAFPLPDVDMAELFEVPIDIPSPESDDFVDFRVTVNGAPVDAQVDQRAIAQAIDRTDLLKSLSIPLNPFSECHPHPREPSPPCAGRALTSRNGIPV